MDIKMLLCWTEYHAAKRGLDALDGRIAAAMAVHARMASGSDERAWRAADAAIRELVAIRQYELAMAGTDTRSIPA